MGGQPPDFVRTILETLCNGNAFGVTPEEVLGGSKQPPVVAIRRALVKELRSRGCSYPRIGQFLNRDHSSIYYLAKT